jgi:gluconolactonase
MKRIYPFLLVLPLTIVSGYACTHKTGDDQPPTAGPGGGDNGGGDNGGGGDPGQTGQPGGGGEDLTKNPIEGIDPPKVVLDTGAFTDGPVWHAGQGVLFFTTPLGEGGLYRMRPDGAAAKVRDGVKATGHVPIGDAVDKAGNLVTFEASRIVRGGAAPDAGAPKDVATGYPGEGGVAPFDTLNDGVIREDGTMYVTDPGYFGTPVANRIYRVTPQGQVTVVEAFEDVPRPNGIALSPDQKILYVGFTQPEQGTNPFVRKYYVNPDGTLGEHAKFADIDPANSEPDGIEVDKAGNVYVAISTGIVVYKPDGTKIGNVGVPDHPTGMAFGDKDMKTLFITTQGTKIFQLHVNVPGIAQ